MAPFRASRSTRSGRPGGQADSDIFDGLPVRQWRVQDSVLSTQLDSDDPSQPGAQESNVVNANGRTASAKWPELPMPKGSNLYTPWSQQLLRAARSGRILKRPVDGSWNEVGNGGSERNDGHENDNRNGEDGSKVDKETKGFLAKRWSTLPKHMEEPEREFLAKRRKGLPRLAADGVVTVTSNGEIINADGTSTAEEPVRRRMPPPRRKPKKGPGRGKKKISDTPGEGVSASAEALAASKARKLENAENGHDGAQDDEKMHDHEGDDDDGDEDEGDEGDDEDREEGELSPSPGREEPPSTSSKSVVPPEDNSGTAAGEDKTEDTQEQNDGPKSARRVSESNTPNATKEMNNGPKTPQLPDRPPGLPGLPGLELRPPELLVPSAAEEKAKPEPAPPRISAPIHGLPPKPVIDANKQT